MACGLESADIKGETSAIRALASLRLFALTRCQKDRGLEERIVKGVGEEDIYEGLGVEIMLNEGSIGVGGTGLAVGAVGRPASENPAGPHPGGHSRGRFPAALSRYTSRIAVAPHSWLHIRNRK